MMIPPRINVGIPTREALRNPRQEIVILTKRGWWIARFDKYGPALVLEDKQLPQHMRLIDPYDVICWMPQDGS